MGLTSGFLCYPFGMCEQSTTTRASLLCKHTRFELKAWYISRDTDRLSNLNYSRFWAILGANTGQRYTILMLATTVNQHRELTQ